MTAPAAGSGPAAAAAPAWQLLASLPAWEITELPRGNDPGPEAAAARDRHARMLALAAACRAGHASAFGWIRAQAPGPVRIITAEGDDGPRSSGDGPDRPGEPAAADPGAGSRAAAPLRFPPGAAGRALPPGSLAVACAALPFWAAVPVTADVLLAQDPWTAGNSAVSLEDGLMRVWRGPFAWLVLARPVSGARRQAMISDVTQTQLAAGKDDAPHARITARRAESRHHELQAAAVTGLWEIWLLAGAATPAAAAQVAGLAAASVPLSGLPFALGARAGAGPLPALLGAPVQALPADGPAFPAPGRPAARPGTAPASAGTGTGTAQRFPDPAPEFPCVASSVLLAALAAPPGREIPGIRMVLEPDFDVTPETHPGGPGTELRLGSVLDVNRAPAGPLTVTEASLNRHTFVCGATGSGKSQTIRHLLESAAAEGVPWLVIEPAKSEYRLMAARLPRAGVVTIRPGDLSAVPAGVNPLEPAAGPDGTRFPLQSHADLVRALFLAAFHAEEPFPQVLSAALTRCYAEAGWDLVTGEPTVDGACYPTLGNLQSTAMDVVDHIGYGKEITDNVRGFVSVRIGSLRDGTPGRFLNGGFPLDYGKLLAGNVILEIEDCGDDQGKAFLTGAMLIGLTEHLRMRARAEGPAAPRLRHLTVIEEAHRLLRRPSPGSTGPALHAVEMLAAMLSEFRAYGEGLIIAEQIPGKLIPDVIKNTAVKIVHRLPAEDDRRTVGATMNITASQSRYLVTLPPGDAAVFADGMDYPLLARMPDGTGRENQAPARTAGPAAMISTRSPACPQACAGDPCTLAQIAAARNAVTADPRITLWAELAVLAHLLGWPPVPQPLPGFAAALDQLGERTRDCALAHAAAEAAGSRRAALVPRTGPGALAGHTAAAMRAVLAGEPGCPLEEQWLAPACEWAAVIGQLRAAVKDETAGRHPRSAEWERQHGRAIPGGDCAEQLDAVTGWQDRAWEQDSTRQSVTVHGRGTPSGIETGIGARTGSPRWDDQVRSVLADTFTQKSCDWAQTYLVPGPQEDEGSR